VSSMNLVESSTDDDVCSIVVILVPKAVADMVDVLETLALMPELIDVEGGSAWTSMTSSPSKGFSVTSELGCGVFCSLVDVLAIKAAETKSTFKPLALALEVD